MSYMLRKNQKSYKILDYHIQLIEFKKNIILGKYSYILLIVSFYYSIQIAFLPVHEIRLYGCVLDVKNGENGKEFS